MALFVKDFDLTVGDSSAQMLTDLSVSSADLLRAESAHLTARGGDISYLYGGTDGIAPTASKGHLIEDNGSIVLASQALIANLTLRSTSGNVSVTLTLIGPV